MATAPCTGSARNRTVLTAGATMRRLAIVLLALALTTGTSAKPSTAADELGAAIKLLKTHHINRDKADWRGIEAKARAMLPRNGKPEDAYPAINLVIKALGEKHTSLFTRDEWKAQMTGEQQNDTKPVQLTPPMFRMLPGRTGYVHVFAFLGNAQVIKDYEARFRAQMSALRKQGACRFVVDLRDNEGGNMWPMLNGLSSLLGDPPFGFFEPGADPGEVWTTKAGEVQGVETDIARVPAYSQKHRDPPVAVLVDRHTSSSGEFTAMAFEGRGGTRVFGQPTAGFVTGNDVFALPDGAEIALTTSGSQDRLRRKYRDRIVPDEITAPGPATDKAALAWLQTQTCG